MEFPKDIWGIITKFQLDWKFSHKIKTTKLFESVRDEIYGWKPMIYRSFNRYPWLPGDTYLIYPDNGWRGVDPIDEKDFSTPANRPTDPLPIMLQITSVEFYDGIITYGKGWYDRTNDCNKRVNGFGKYTKIRSDNSPSVYSVFGMVGNRSRYASLLL